jgi:16S rRNA (uracil1498-N3)-methyltransferase
MRHRIYTRDPLVDAVSIGGEEFHHAARVVRVGEGEEVELFDGEGHAVSGVVESIGSNALVVRVGAPISSRESEIEIDLAMAIIQLEKFELVLQKSTELGVRSVIPLETDRQEIRAERYKGKHDRWQKILFEATKQSGRAVIPKLELPTSFDDVMKRENKTLFDAEVHPSTEQPSNPATLLIGPEGGWSERELAVAREHDCTFAQLGPRRLRAETAAIVACALLNDRFTRRRD